MWSELPHLNQLRNLAVSQGGGGLAEIKDEAGKCFFVYNLYSIYSIRCVVIIINN